MFEHLVHFPPEAGKQPPGFTPLHEADPNTILGAQAATAALFEELGVPPDEEVDKHLQTSAAREAFSRIVVPHTDPGAITDALLAVKTPEAVRHLTGMLSAYDWEFVHQAKNIRGYAVAKILEETNNPDPKIRMRALDMLGKVTEVALFTERITVKKEVESDEELDARIRARLDKYRLLLPPADVTDVAPKTGETQELDG